MEANRCRAPQTIDTAQIADGKLLVSYMKDAHSAARMFALDGKPIADIAMPGIGTAAWSPARLQDKEMFYGFDGFTIAPGIYRLDLETGKSEVIRQSKVARGFVAVRNATGLLSEQRRHARSNVSEPQKRH